MALQPHCTPTWIKDFGSNFTLQNSSFSAANFTESDACLKTTSGKFANFNAHFDVCQSHQYIWVHLECDTEAVFAIQSTTCNGTKLVHPVHHANGTWTTHQGNYTDGFLLRASDLQSLDLLNASVANYTLKKLAFVDCDSTANVNWTMAADHNGTANVNWGMAADHNSTGSVNWGMAADHNSSASINWTMAKNWSAQATTFAPATPTNNTLYPAWNQSATSPQVWHRESLYDGCEVVDLGATPTATNAQISDKTIYVSSTDAQIIFPLSDFDLSSFDKILFKFAADAGTAMTIDVEHEGKWHKSPYSRVVVPDSRERSILFDLTAYDWPSKHISGIRLSAFNKPTQIHLTQSSFLNCLKPKTVLPTCSTERIILNDFLTGDLHRNRRGLHMGCDGTAQSIQLSNGSLEITPWQNSTNNTYWYTNIGSPCFSQSLEGFTTPALQVEVKAPVGALFDLQLEFADECTKYARDNYTVKQLPSASYVNYMNTSSQVLNVPLSSDEFAKLFSLYLMNIHANGSLVIDHVHIVDLGCTYPEVATPTPTVPETNVTVASTVPTTPAVPYYALNNFTSGNDSMNIRGFKMGCDGTAKSVKLGNGSLEIDPTDLHNKSTPDTYWYTNVGAPCFAQNFTNFTRPAIELQVRALKNTTFEVQLEFADSCDSLDRGHYRVKQIASTDLCKWAEDGEQLVHIPVDHAEFQTLFSIYLMRIDSKGPLTLDHVHVVDLDQ